MVRRQTEDQIRAPLPSVFYELAPPYDAAAAGCGPAAAAGAGAGAIGFSVPWFRRFQRSAMVPAAGS